MTKFLRLFIVIVLYSSLLAAQGISLIQTFPGLPPSGRNGSNLGEELSALGDVNGDGFNDYAIGIKHGAVYPSGEKLGMVYVYFGGSVLVNEKSPDIILTGEKDSDRFGSSVAGAGDVNNDGYDDIIIGAEWNSAVHLFSGSAYIFLGGITIDNTPDVVFYGEGFNNYLGNSVSSAGDINNDGFADVVIGAFRYSTEKTAVGRAFIYLGGSVMDNTADLILEGEDPEDTFGNSVAFAGDVNSDGFSDIIIGAELNDAGGVDAGRAYIFYGGVFLDAAPDVILSGQKNLDHFGSSVSTAGDVNHDGYFDVVVGAVTANRSYLYFGSAAMDNNTDLILAGTTWYDNFGCSVTSGDFNQDGFSDLVIGASAGGETIAGRAYFYFGKAQPDSIPDLIFNGEDEFDNFGYNLCSAGDINKDGYDDLIIGAYWNSANGHYAGRCYLYPGSNSINDVPEAIMSGEASYDYFAKIVASAGDVNGDGFSDFIISAPENDIAGDNAGSVYLFYGGLNIDQISDVVFTGNADNDFFGISTSSAGDVNNDGYSDIIIGATGTFAGKANIYFGGVQMDTIADITFYGEESFDMFGSSTTSAGDVNNDGFDDVIIGANSFDAGEFDIGRAYIFFGGTVMDNSPDIILTGEDDTDYFGSSVNSAGDVNNDGFDDVIIGAYLNSAGGSSAGRAYIFFGSSSMDSIADYIIPAPQALGRFGACVASAGDINSDGFSDFIIGAPLDGGSGRAYLFLGGNTVDINADIIFTGEDFGDNFGISTASAGDVNNDGYDDIIIGASTNSATSSGAGRVYLYFGSMNMDNTPDGVFTGEASADFFGGCVVTAGDVNNDGYSDFLIGAQGNSAVGYKMGKAYLYSGGRVIIGVEQNEDVLPNQYTLYQNYPNPFNQTTVIKYFLTERNFVQIKVIDMLGREITDLVAKEQEPGMHEVTLLADGISSGIYFYNVKAGHFRSTKKLMLLK